MTDAAARAAPPQQMWRGAQEIDIRIARDGTWHHEGAPIRRQRLVRLFASILRRGDDGGFYLVAPGVTPGGTPGEIRRIRVDDAPFVAVDATLQGRGRGQSVTLTTNVGDRVVAGRDHPLRVACDPESGQPSPYVLVRDGLEALIARAVYYRLVEAGRAVRRDGRWLWGIDAGGCFFVLGEAEDDPR